MRSTEDINLCVNPSFLFARGNQLISRHFTTLDERAAIASAVTRRLRGADYNAVQDWFEPSLSANAAAWISRIVALAGRSRGGRQHVTGDTVDGVLSDGIETINVVELDLELAALKAWDGLRPLIALV